MSELKRTVVDIGFAKTIIHKTFRSMYEQVKSGKNPTARPIFLHSSPGIGKSAIVAQVAKLASKELNIEIGFRDFRLASCEASDLCGIPFVSHAGAETELMKFSVPDWFPTDQKSFGILFLDELSNAPVSVQHAAYRLVNDRELHDGVILPPGWMIVAAGNLKTDKTGVKGIAPALANRFGSHLYIKPSVEAFTSYAVQHDIHHHIIGFLSFKQDCLYQAAKAGGEDAFATPRSWEAASEYLKSNYSDDELDILLSGCLGEGMASDFIGFREFYGKLPDMEKIMTGKETYTVKNENKGLSFALVTSIVSCILAHSKDKARLSNLEKIVSQLDDDFLVFLFRSLTQSHADMVMIMMVMAPILKKVSKRITV